MIIIGIFRQKRTPSWFENSAKNASLPYDPELEIVVTCDSSNYGVRVVLENVLPNGTERPVVFASRTSSKFEKKYVQNIFSKVILCFLVWL